VRVPVHGGCLNGQTVDVTDPPPYSICAEPPITFEYAPGDPIPVTAERHEPEIYRRWGRGDGAWLYVLAGTEPPQ